MNVVWTRFVQATYQIYFDMRIILHMRWMPVIKHTRVCMSRARRVLQSDRVASAVYSMQWARAPPRFRRQLVLLMQFVRRPLRPTAGRVIPLSLDTFVKVKATYPFCFLCLLHDITWKRNIFGTDSANLFIFQILKSSYTFYAVLRQTK